MHPSVDSSLIINTAEGGAIVRPQRTRGPATEAINVAGAVQRMRSHCLLYPLDDGLQRGLRPGSRRDLKTLSAVSHRTCLCLGPFAPSTCLGDVGQSRQRIRVGQLQIASHHSPPKPETSSSQVLAVLSNRI